MRTTWSEPPVLGLTPLFHLDPALGGPPLVTPDGHWRWQRDHWVALDLSDVGDLGDVGELGDSSAA